ncbi:MAG: helix-turn-helix domain-containing protein [Acidimicrobiales bacterium]|jgi:excisionase family DNA binding protein|nr:helix-turn-helix domain-containing protein [Acidimicrobiales bacterium]
MTTKPNLDPLEEPMTPESPPDVLTVEEAAQILRIGRNSAYGLARRWIDTGGAEGLPAIRLGRCLRVPRSALEQLLGGPLDTRDDEPDSGTVISLDRSRPARTR